MIVLHSHTELQSFLAIVLIFWELQLNITVNLKSESLWYQDWQRSLTGLRILLRGHLCLEHWFKSTRIDRPTFRTSRCHNFWLDMWEELGNRNISVADQQAAFMLWIKRRALDNSSREVTGSCGIGQRMRSHDLMKASRWLRPSRSQDVFQLYVLFLTSTIHILSI